MNRRRSLLLAFATAVTTIAVIESPSPTPVQAAAADGCLPTNGLMNLNNADDLLAGTVKVRSSKTVQIGSGNIDWTQASLNSQDARLLYSLKWVEELVREHRRTGNAAYLNRAIAIVLDFAADHPVNGGPDPVDAWFPMHAGQRATAIACVAAVTDHAGVDAALRTHASWLSGIVGELDPWNQAIDPHLGLVMAGCELGSSTWRNQGRAAFESLINVMINADGSLLDQAPGYGRFIWERWGVVKDYLDECGLAPIGAIDQRRAALLDWLAWVSDPDGDISVFGDSFVTNVPPAPDGSATQYTTTQGAQGTPPSGNVKVFDSGYVLGRDSWNDYANSTFWSLRFGPGRDYHGHEDRTAVTFWADGYEVLIDSGHGGYSDSEYREALRSAEAHNVLVLPGETPRLREPAQLVRSDSGAGWRFDEVSDNQWNYQQGRTVDAPRIRGVLVIPDDGVMVVQDRAWRPAGGLFEQLWHLVPGATIVSSDRNGVVARHPSGAVDMHIRQVPLPGLSLPSNATATVEGQTDPLLGWYSEANGEREAAPVVKLRQEGTLARFVTIITTTRVGGDVSAVARAKPNGWTIALDVEGDSHAIGVGYDGAMRVGDVTRAATGAVQPGTRRCFEVAGDPGDAAIVNLTPVEAGDAGNGLLVSSDLTRPPVAANVNYAAGSVDPNVAIAPIGADGQVCFQNAWRTDVQVVADHLGTIDAASYQPATAGGAPERVLDTRESSIVRSNSRRCFAVAGDPGDAAIVNLTPVSAGANGNGLLISSDVDDAPVAANVNYAAGSVDPNVAIAPIGTDGQVCFQNARLTSVHVVADHLGTIDAASYRPATSTGAPKRVTDTRS